MCRDQCLNCPPYVSWSSLTEDQHRECASPPLDTCGIQCGAYVACQVGTPSPVLEPSSCPSTSRSRLDGFPRRYRNKGWCNTNCKPAIRKDPHLYLPHGGRADFRGQHDTIFNLLSAKNVSFSVKMEEADFNWATRLVHGTKMAAAYWTLRTYHGNTLMVEYSAKTGETSARVTEKHHRAVTIKDGQPPLSVDNVWIQLVGKALTVATDRWSFRAEKSAFPFARRDTNKNKARPSPAPPHASPGSGLHCPPPPPPASPMPQPLSSISSGSARREHLATVQRRFGCGGAPRDHRPGLRRRCACGRRQDRH